MPKAVLHVSETMLGGVGAVIADLGRAQLAAGWRVAVAAPEEPGVSGLTAHTWVPGARPGIGLPHALAVLRGIIERESPDLVHLHSSMAGMCGRLVVRRRLPTLLQPHSWSFFALTGLVHSGAVAWERAGARWADAVLCVSEDERRAAERCRLRLRRSVVIPNGIDLDRFRPRERAAARARLGLGTAPLAVCVGRLHRQKGQHLLLDAWPRVLRRVPAAQLAFVGDGPDRSALEHRHPEATTFVGQSEAVSDWVAAADVIVQPSVWEGMSLSLLEAMAGGRSVVVTDVSGMREVVRPGCGGIVPAGDAVALAAAVSERLSDPGLAAAEGSAGRRAVEEHHDLAARRAQVIELSAELAAGSER